MPSLRQRGSGDGVSRDQTLALYRLWSTMATLFICELAMHERAWLVWLGRIDCISC